MDFKIIIAYLNKNKKLINNNYNIWHQNVQYLLQEQMVLETINHVEFEPAPKGDIEAYHA